MSVRTNAPLVYIVSGTASAGQEAERMHIGVVLPMNREARQTHADKAGVRRQPDRWRLGV